MNKYKNKILSRISIIFLSLFLILLINGYFFFIPFIIFMISSSLYIINIKNNYNNNNNNIDNNIDNNIILDNREEKSYIKEITLVRNRDLNKKKKRVLHR